MNFSSADILKPTILLAIALMVVIIMMVVPVPSIVLDLGLAISFALAILIFTVTLFIERPLDFSAFPTVLLASLMLRLSLNVSSTKLIIGEGHTGTNAAGNVIEGFAMFVMSGSVLIGLVVFTVLLIVNFMVITKGAGRMAEVGARFALDGMPGRQLSIDADLSAGAITHAEAKERRETELAETTFFGSLDGASKFVKGDAVAGLLITLMNIVMGLVIGISLHDMPIGRAFETYAILTVGDGLVSQIPSVIISIAAALLLAKGGSKGSADLAFFAQLGKYPPALFTVAILMLLFGTIPGLPFIPFALGSAGLGIAGYYVLKQNNAQKDEIEPLIEPTENATESLGDILDLDDIHVEFSSDLVAMVLDQQTGIDARIINMRSHIATNFGLILPEIRLTDDPLLPDGAYVIRIQGVIQAQDILKPNQLLALISGDPEMMPSGIDVTEPVYRAPARWITADKKEEAALSGLTVVSPTEVLATHLLEVIKENFSRLLTLKSLRKLLDELSNLSDASRAQANQKLINELIPDKVPMDLLLSVLRLLLEERVSIRNIGLILETIAEARGSHATPETICEFVRHRLGFQLISEMKREDGTIPLLQLAPEWEEAFVMYQIDGDRGQTDVALPPDDFNRLAQTIAEKISLVGENGIYPAIVTSSKRRRFIRAVLLAQGIQNPVFSFEEINGNAKPSLVGLVTA